jgi:hypothetical protein
MKSLRQYLQEAEVAYSRPVAGDNFAINIREEFLLETYVVDSNNDAVVIHADDRMMQVLESYGFLGEELAEGQDYEDNSNDDMSDIEQQDAGEYDYEGDMAKDDLETIVRAARRLTGMLDDNENMPEWVQSKINKAADYVDTAADYIESNQDDRVVKSIKSGLGEQDVAEIDIDEAEYQGRKVPLGKPMAGDVKKSKVYVKGPKGNVVKVNFGQKGMKIKKNIPGRRKNFRARHNCDNPGPRWKARYWSCRAW